MYAASIDVYPGQMPEEHTIYMVATLAGVNSIVYGQTSGPGILWGGAAVSTLSPGLPYAIEVRAIDATNWCFAQSGRQEFTTAGS